MSTHLKNLHDPKLLYLMQQTIRDLGITDASQEECHDILTGISASAFMWLVSLLAMKRLGWIKQGLFMNELYAKDGSIQAGNAWQWLQKQPECKKLLIEALKT